MALIVAELPEQIIDDICDHIGGDKSKALELLREMSVRDAFEAWLAWHGIIGYTAMITRALDSIRKAELPL